MYFQSRLLAMCQAVPLVLSVKRIRSSAILAS